jgi:serine acetyltransferase
MNKSLVRRIMSRVLGKLARSLPGATSIRPMLHRARGVQIRGRVFIGDDVYIESEYPECIIIEDGAQIGLRSTLVAHTRGSGQIVIGQNVFIGASCVIIAPEGAELTIGEGSVVGAGAVITSDVPAGTLVAPERTKAYAQVTVPFTMDTDYQQFRMGLRPLRSPGRSIATGEGTQK